MKTVELEQREFFKTLFEDTAGFIEIRALGLDHSIIQEFRVGCIEALRAVQEIPSGYNIHFGMCTRRDKRGKEEDVLHVPTLWAEVDAKHFEPRAEPDPKKNPAGFAPEALKRGKEKARRAIDAFEFQPSILVDSGGGYHLYWLLKEPEVIETPEDRLRVRGYLIGIQEAIHSDTVHDLARILRVPGTHNLKYASVLPEPPVVTVVYADADRRHNLMDFDDYFTEDTQGHKAIVTIGEIPKELPERFKELLKNDPPLKDTWEGDRPDLNDQTRSGYDMALAVQLVKRGFDDEEIAGILRQSPSGKRDEATDQYLALTISKARTFEENRAPGVKVDKLLEDAANASGNERDELLREAIGFIGHMDPLARERYREKLEKKPLSVPRRVFNEMVKQKKVPCPVQKPSAQYIALFEGLVDIVERDEAPLFLVRDGDRLETASDVLLDGERYLPPPRASLPFLLPRADEVLKWYEEDSDEELYKALLKYHRGISELPSKRHYDLLVAWDFHSYMLEPVQYSPMTWFFAVPERGKSRTGKGMIYVAFRGVHVESLRDAYLIRLSENLGASIFFDVRDFWKKAIRTGSEDIVLLRFEKGAVVPRVLYPDRGPHQDTVYYKVFGPTIISTNESVAPVLESRTIPITMPDSRRQFEEDVRPETGLPFKERLVAFRARHLGESFPDVAKPARGRLGDILRPLVQILHLVHPDREPVFLELIEELGQQRLLERAESIEARLLLKVVQLKDEVQGALLPIKTVVEAYNDALPEQLHLTPQKVGWTLKAMGLEKSRMPKGRAAAIVWDPCQVERLLEQYGLNISDEDDGKSPPNPPNPPESAPDAGSDAKDVEEESPESSDILEDLPF